MAISKIQEFVNVILEILSPMSNVNVIKNKGHIVLYKDGVMFGKIIEQSVLLLSNNNKFIEVKNELISRILRPKNQLDQSDCDAFLFRATKSWWLAKNKIWTISATKGFLENIYYIQLNRISQISVSYIAFTRIPMVQLSDFMGFRGHLCIRFRYGLVTRSPLLKVALSVGFNILVSLHIATQATRF